MEMHDVNEIMSIRQGHLKQDIDFFYKFTILYLVIYCLYLISGKTKHSRIFISNWYNPLSDSKKGEFLVCRILWNIISTDSLPDYVLTRATYEYAHIIYSTLHSRPNILDDQTYRCINLGPPSVPPAATSIYRFLLTQIDPKNP